MGKDLRRISDYCLKFSILGLLTTLSCLGIQDYSVSSPENFQTLSCPADLETLTALLLQDLPSYANRVTQRSRRLERSVNLFSYVIVAGKPEFEPLNLSQLQYTPVLPDTSEQIFFTTLERRYSNNQAIETQNYHWLFLTQTSSGWRLVLLFSQFGSVNPEQPPTPPQETSDGVIGQAVRLWLRDCRAGAIRT